MPSLLSLVLALSASVRATEPPRLVVLVVVDQLVPEQLERLAPRLDGGLGRFQRRGLAFRAAELGYARTETGPGHATLATGTFPSTHGIVGNSFFDRERRALVYCVEDASTLAVTSSGVVAGSPDVSPRNLRVPALGDVLAAEHPASRTVSIAGKDRSAVTMGGREADLALWWNRAAGGFESSTYYAEELPAWVAEWNASWAERYAHFAADGWRALDEPLECTGTAPDERAGEAISLARSSTLPYALPPADATSDAAGLARAARATFTTPLADGFVLGLAARAVEELDLGGGVAPDVLAVGLSACDVVGHACGPYSREVTDVILRADDALGELFELLDERLGAGGWVACLSADHGVLELPEALAARGVDAGRIPGSELVRLRDSVIQRLTETFDSDLGFDYVDGLVFDPDALEERELDPAGVWDLAASVALELPWVRRAFPYDELRASTADDLDPLRRLMARSVAEGRGPDVALVQQPWKLLGMPTGTSHGTPYRYDRRIPLVFLGPGFEAGECFDPAGAVDAAPTLLGALGVAAPPFMEGRDLARR